MKKERIKIILSWLPAALVMITVFYLSSQCSDDSAQVSMGFLDWLENKIHININHDVLREVAHGCEYFGLGLTLSFAFFETFKKQRPFVEITAAFAYALSDEIHQIFVPGRAFEIKDILIDLAGILVGTLVFFILHLMISKIKQKRKVCC